MIGEPEGPPLVLYDGVCALCNWAVQFIVDRDPKGIFRFAPLQSEAGRSWMNRFNLSSEEDDTVILVRSGRVFVRSAAAFEILRQLSTGWRFLLMFGLLPTSATDVVYRLVARWRYRIFGRYDACPLPPPHLRHRFLDGSLPKPSP